MLTENVSRNFRRTIVFLILIMPSLLNAGQDEYDECMLKHLKGAKQDVAVHLISQACDENYKNPSFTTEKRKAFNNCLLEHLVGVESIKAVMEIQSICGRIHR